MTIRSAFRSLSAAAFAAAVLALFAPFSSPAMDSPIGISVNYDGGARFPGPNDSVYGIRLGVIQARNKNMFGIAATALINSDDGSGYSSGEVAGFQLAGISNFAKRSDWGVWQVSAFCNILEQDSRGVQIGLANFMEGGGEGLQFGVWNQADGEWWGVQVAAFANTVENDLHGVQIAPLNVCNGVVSGLQLGLFNHAARGLSGLQIGVVNRVPSGFIEGAQIGLLNIYDGPADSFSGMQLGAVDSGERFAAPVLPLFRMSF